MLERYKVETAIINQQIAETRRHWAVIEREEYVDCVRHGWNGRLSALVEFITWSDESAGYARRAMEAMGVTEEDQFYA